MKKLKPFPERTFAASGQYDTEINGVMISGITLQADFSATADGTGVTARSDAAFRLLGTPEINQAEDPLIRMAGPDWYHLAALSNGAYPKAQQGDIAASQTGKPLAVARLRLGRLVPGMMLNSSIVKCYLRGTFGALGDFDNGGGNIASASGKLRPFVETTDKAAVGGYLRPRINQATVNLSTAGDNIQHVIRFENDQVVPGLMLRAHDFDADICNVDGLVRRLRVDITSNTTGQTETHRMTWGQARTQTLQRFGLSPEDEARSKGIVFLEFVDESSRFGGAMVFRAGESITLTIDTAAAVENQFAAVTPGAGDLLYVTTIGAQQVDGDGQRAGNSPRITAAPASNNRRARRRAAALR